MKFFKKKPKHKDWIEALGKNIDEGRFVEIFKEDAENLNSSIIIKTKIYLSWENFELTIWSHMHGMTYIKGLRVYFKKERLDLEEVEENFLRLKAEDFLQKEYNIKQRLLESQAKEALLSLSPQN